MAVLAASMLMALAGLGGQAPDWQWVQAAGGADWDEGTCIASDVQGNVYVAGFFYGNATFGSTVLTSTMDRNLFVAKLDPDGNWLWAQRSGGTDLTGLAVDGAGNAYITGYFWNSADFGPHTLIAAGYGSYDDIFVAKLDPDGNWLWATRAGGVNTDRGMGIALDSSGMVYLTGFYSYDAVMGGISLNCAGAWDVFVAKLDPNGNWLWAVGAGGLGYELGEDLVLDVSGNIYLTGSFQMTVNFGAQNLVCAGERDILIAKLDPDGNWLWARRAGGWHYDHGTAIALDGSSLYCAGYFRESGDYGNDILTSAGSYDIFVCKLNTEGDWLWARREGGTESDQAFGMALDAEGYIWLAGRFQSSVDIGPTILISAGDYDVLLARLDPAGNWLRAIGAGSNYSDSATGVLAGGSELFAAGSFMDSAIFGSQTVISEGGVDVWVAKLNPNVGIGEEVAVPGPDKGHLTAWPNPFTFTTLLKADYDPEEFGSNAVAILEIHDLRGRKLRSLPCMVASLRDTGIAWDGRSDEGDLCPAGIYLIKLVYQGKTIAQGKTALIH
jgi:hypothetical protein